MGFYPLACLPPQGHSYRDAIDVKPDNILVNWTSDAQNTKTVTDAVLGNFDVAHKLALAVCARHRML